MLPVHQIVQQFTTTVTIKALTWRAFHAGSLIAFQYRLSSHSPTGTAFVAHFAKYRCAIRFAKSINKFGVPVTFRQSPAGGWQVAIPAPRPYSRLPKYTGAIIPVRGGVLGLYRTLSSFGFNTF